MKANELMVGDYLMSDSLPYRVIQVSGIVCDGWMLENGEENCGKPIPLTPEILEKNGFKKFDFQHIEGQHQWSWWLNTQTSVSLWCRELKDDTKDGWMIRIDSPSLSLCKIVNAVHELQHALRLCGIEKEIEL